jgi:hypothetical protein
MRLSVVKQLTVHNISSAAVIGIKCGELDTTSSSYPACVSASVSINRKVDFFTVVLCVVSTLSWFLNS